ncbi:hypothetical protein OOC_01145 [Providencia rettgeri Dmel1]|nr:hypothetical protein OOC_01145 [Providencia rettgeri Dmel1]
MLVNLQAKAISPQHSRSQIHTENIQNKMTSLWQKKNMDSKKIDFSPKEKIKLTSLLMNLSQKKIEKYFFLTYLRR